MVTRSQRPRVRAAQWAERVSAWQRSGLTLARFAAQNGYNSRRLSWWRWALARRAAPTSASAGATFVPVRVVATPEATSPAAIEIVLGNGRQVRVRGAFDADHLAQVLAAAERA